MSASNGRAGAACAIAIVGCAGRFPGAASVEEFWQNLCAGVESVRTFGEDELEDGVAAEVRARPEYVAARAIVDGVENFDAGFFGMHAREAELTDPQHRIFLECCWQALEDAGYDPAAFDGSIGVYAGSSLSSYLLRSVLAGRADVERFTGEYQAGSMAELLGTGYDFLATRVAYKLDLRGPAMTLQSACSTSLLAVAQACQTLLSRQADMMLAGGVSITFPQKRGTLYQDGGMASRDGHCRTFDARANGTVFGDGCGVVVLKRLEDALAAGDAIYAVIRGFGINNDGASKAGYTAPSIEGQAAAIRTAHAMAGFEPETIGFVECHGTATPLGDPIEVAALQRAFGSAGSHKRCALGSLKTNVGHLDVASGVTGLIKAALAVERGTIPATLHFERPNPSLELEQGPFFVNPATIDWHSGAATRRAGVSSFGLGGTNVHVVLESAPPRTPAIPSDAPQLLVLSARSASALDAARSALAARLRSASDVRLEDAAHTLQSGRRHFPFRASLVAASAADAVAALESGKRVASGRAGESAPAVAFMFPGQGAQYAGMGRDLYLRVPSFRATVDRCADVLQPLLGYDLSRRLYADDEAASPDATEFAQPALFTIEFALAELLREYGIEAVASVGHSVGEFVAATLAGVFSLEDALALVAERGRLIRGLAPGAMLAVRAGERELQALLDPDLDVAARNSPELAVVSGPTGAIARFEARLSELEVPARRLHTSHAFHSAMMEPIVEPLTQRIAAMRLSPPAKPYVSGVTGTWITSEDATSPAYWARHCRDGVRFADALATLVEAGVRSLVEVGPGSALGTFALQGAAKDGRAAVLRTLPGSEREQSGFESVLDAVGRLWTQGSAPDWNALHGGEPRARVSLPTYPFERSRYWIAPPAPATLVADSSHGTFTADSAQSTLAADSSSTSVSSAADVRSSGESGADATPAADIGAELVALLEDLSGERLANAPAGATFLELGFDSLFLGRLAQQIRTRFGVTVTFRQLLGDIPSIDALADFIGTQRKATAAPAQSTSSTSGAVAAASPAAQAAEPAKAPVSNGSASRFEAFRIAPAAKAEITPAQRAHIDDLIARTVARTAESKRLTQRYRAVLADPRVAAGFRTEWKEIVYPITCVRAKGSRLWDVDGNEYVDLLNGFGQTAFGHAPDFVTEAVGAQLERGFAIGPQTDLAGDVAELFCELTGNERVTFCNTGSEAVMAALRVARTVTGRDRVVLFEGAYHGQFDEVLVKSASTSHRSLPVALGIPAEAVANVTVLPYGTSESLAWIREHADELAAVVVEPVQSRHPALRPAEFLKELRGITEASGSALVFDEVVTGFRTHPAGMQAVFGIRADLATYGKVVGGGLPVGILAGKARFMDALDGGAWRFGDDSFPEVAPTFFAGTFVRHPLVMAAVLAVLRHVKAQGPALQEALGRRTASLVERLNAALATRGIGSRIESYGSLFYLNLGAEDRLAGLLFYHLRLRGIYVQEGFPCFLTTEHTDADSASIVCAFEEALDELQAAGILASHDARACALTEEQTEIWLSAQMSDEASCAFNESVTLRLRGPFDERAWQAACDALLARHDALRASFGTTGETMRIAPLAELAFARHDFSSESAAAGEDALRRLVDEDARTPFDLAAGPLVRGHLVRFGPEDRAFVLTAHHIVCDGWSVNVLLSELAQLYEASRRGTSAGLAEPRAFRAYAAAQTQRDPATRKRVEAFWLAQYADAPPVLELPADRPRPALKTFRGATRTAYIEGAAYQAIKKAGARLGCTLFTTLLTAFDVLAGRLSDQNDIVVGVPAAGQALLDDDAILVGHCVDFLPLRARWNRDTTLAQLLGQVRQHVLDAYEHQQYTLGTLVRELAPAREANRTPLAEIQFNLERLAEDLPFDELDATVEPNPKACVNFDLFLNVVESRDGLRLDCDYNSDLFDAATIERWLDYYRNILAEIERDPGQTVTGFSYLAPSDGALLERLNATGAEYPRECTIHELFAQTAARYPGEPAIRFADEVLSYAEALDRTKRLARQLRRRLGEGPRRVAVCVERSAQLAVALLATLEAGYTYVPLDPAHPPARLRRIVEDAGCAAILSDGSAGPALLPPGTTLLDLRELLAARDESGESAGDAADGAPRAALRAEDPAYVIYTSGSTGQPKGVAVAHRSVVNLLRSFAASLALGPGDELLAVTTVSFDIAGLELFLPLTTGATVRIAAAADVADPFALVAQLATSRVSAMQATPALWGMLLEAGFRSRRDLTMLCGGEALSFELAQRLLEGGGPLWNVYGPTETTIWSTCARLEPGAPIAAGTPIANTQCYVLDRNDRLVPPGIAGQLHIAGDGVALEYVGRPDLTAASFVPNPFGPGRMYRTGDAARVLPNGQIQILGRLDRQVKLRGFRIEPGEIEAAILAKSELSAVSVIVREDVPGDRQLVCYYTGGSAELGEAELRALVAGELPEYMIPARWVALERMPLTAAGKIDRAALPAPEKSSGSSTFSAPATATESALAEIWANVLQLERVGRDDDFIALGGDSIQLFQITARANKNGLAIAARQLLKHRTIAALARELDENPQVPAAQNGAMPPFAFRKVRPAEPAEVPHEVSA